MYNRNFTYIFNYQPMLNWSYKKVLCSGIKVQKSQLPTNTKCLNLYSSARFIAKTPPKLCPTIVISSEISTLFCLNKESFQSSNVSLAVSCNIGTSTFQPLFSNTDFTYGNQLSCGLPNQPCSNKAFDIVVSFRVYYLANIFQKPIFGKHRIQYKIVYL